MSLERELLPAWGRFAPFIVASLTSAIRPPVPIRAVLTVWASYFLYWLTANYNTGGGVAQDYTAGCANGTAACSLWVFGWLCDPLKDWRYKGEKEAPRDYPLLKRVYYAACLQLNIRLVGCSAQVSSVPPPRAASSRREFLIDRSLRVLQCLLYIDIAQSYVHLQPAFSLQGTDQFPTGLRGYVLHTACVFAWRLQTYAALKLGHTLVALFCVATGLFNRNPEDWRDMFGNWSDAYTVRRFWGRTWHQQFRRLFNIPGRSLVSTLGLRKGGTSSAYVQLYLAFFLSGLIHVYGDIMVGTQHTGKSIPFFMLQALVITFEDGVIAVARRVTGSGERGPTLTMRLLGYAWVLVWFSVSLRAQLEWMVPLGVAGPEWLPFSLVRAFPPM
ncbi:membrane bound O-acyl transferase family-domain-containing protein [Trametes maxima]|nr:membrane bound O-acyl transferase family-domain-containing protein [Trametes maxima]